MRQSGFRRVLTAVEAAFAPFQYGECEHCMHAGGLRINRYKFHGLRHSGMG